MNYTTIYIHTHTYFIYFLKILFVYFYREEKGGRKRGRETVACNPGMCPDWELNPRPSGSQDGTQSSEPHQPEHAYTHTHTHTHILITVGKI